LQLAIIEKRTEKGGKAMMRQTLIAIDNASSRFPSELNTRVSM
jgi:hypothetical protein